MQPSAAVADPPTEAEPLGRRIAERWDAAREFVGARRYELAGVLAVLALALVVRLVELGRTPEIVTADEADNLQTAYHIIEGTGPGFFGFDWKPAPIFSLYPLAWTIQVFGDSITAFRLFTVIMSMLTVIGFYLVARRVMAPFAALAAMTLLATNLLFLHFSRTAWENMNAPLFAIGACYATQRALSETEGRLWVRWWAATGVFVALGFYGYFAGRFIFLAVALVAFIAIAIGDAPARPALKGLAIAAGVSAVLFLPMAKEILENWDLFTRRTSIVSVFGIPEDQPFEGETNGWVIAAKNLERNYEGFILHDGSEMNRGLWGRYNPGDRAPLGFVGKHLFWGGLLVSLALWRKTYAWWPFFVPLFIVEVFSLGTPDVARGLIITPFYFLFIGLLIHEGRSLLMSRRLRRVGAAAVLALVVFLAASNVGDYFDWQDRRDTQGLRLPGVAACEFDLWSDLAREAAAAGPGNIDNAKFDAQRRELACSPLINDWLPPPPE